MCPRFVSNSTVAQGQDYRKWPYMPLLQQRVEVSCGGNDDHIHRHGSIRDAIFSATQSAALALQRGSCPYSDIYVPNPGTGQPAAHAGCMHVISTLQPRTINAANNPGHALRVGGIESILSLCWSMFYSASIGHFHNFLLGQSLSVLEGEYIIFLD